jgi:anti-anti-sigma regulatory factor
MPTQTERHGDAVVIRVDGVFDVPAAHRLSRQLAQTPDGGAVRIDLTHVREFHDFGVTVLAHALATRGAQVVVRGLRQHHLRLLRYLGIETGVADLGDPAETV